jgi:hypothetical protein
MIKWSHIYGAFCAFGFMFWARVLMHWLLKG